jgi:TolA-binding protein
MLCSVHGRKPLVQRWFAAQVLYIIRVGVYCLSMCSCGGLCGPYAVLHAQPVQPALLTPLGSRSAFGVPYTPPQGYSYDYGAALADCAAQEMKSLLEQETSRLANAALRGFPISAAGDQALLRLAQAQFRAGRYEAGYRAIDSLATTRPNSPLLAHAYTARAERLLEQKKYLTAHESFAAATLQAQRDVAARPSAGAEYTTLAANALYWDGVSLTLANKNAEAQPCFTLCAEQYPKSEYADDALYCMARFAEQRGEHEQAVSLYERITRTYPERNTRLAAHLRMAHNYVALRQANDALAQLETASSLEANPTPQAEPQTYVANAAEQALYLRGEANNLSARYEAALQAFDKLLTVHPQSPYTLRARIGRGFVLLNLGKNDDALKQYELVIDADLATVGVVSTDEKSIATTARLYHAIALKRKGNIEQDSTSREAARRELNALALRADYSYSPQALLELGQMQYEDGKLDEARKTLERAAREAQDVVLQTRSQLLLGEVCVEAGFYAVAVKAFERVQELAERATPRVMPNRGLYLAEAALKRGVALVGAKRSTDAIATLQKFLNQYTESDGRPEAAFWLAEAYYQADLMKNAENAYQAFVQHHAEHLRAEEAWYGLGWTRFRTRQFTESASTFARMLKEFPNSRYALDVYTRKGDGHYLGKQYKPAAEAYRQAARLKPKSEQGEYAAFQLGQCLYRLQDFDQATNEMERFLKMYPNSTLADDAAYLLGWMAFQQKRYTDAVTQFKILADTYPDGSATGRGFYAMGDALFNLGQYDAALTSYQTVADRYPASPLAADAVNAVQYCLNMLGREQEAVAVADKYISANPNSTLSQDVKFKKAELFFNGRKYQSAIAEYEDFIAQNPQSDRAAEAMLMMGKSYAGMGDTSSIARAMQTFSRIQTSYPNSTTAPQAALEAALTSLQQRRFAEADTLFAETISRYTASEAATRAAFERANLREQRGDTLAAIALYRNVADRYAGSDYGDRCRYRVATWLRRQGNLDSARTLLQPLTERTDELGAEAQYRIGEYYQREKNFGKALEAFAQNKAKFPDMEDWYSLALLNTGYCHEQLKNYEAAKEAYRLVLVVRRDASDDEFARAARQSLERLTKM